MIDGDSRQAKATTFVTVLAWILISFTGLGAASALLHNVVFNIIPLLLDMHSRGTAAQTPQDFFALRVLIALLFAFLTFALVSAIAFLKRKQWARRTFVALFVLAIALHAAAALLFLLGAGLFAPPTPVSDAKFDAMVKAMLIPVALWAVGMSVLFGWLIKRLMSPDVRREFGGSVAT